MLKKISKRILKIVLWIIGGFIAFDLLVVALIFVPPIQQFTVLKVSKVLTDLTGGEITVDKIYLSPFLTLTAKNFAIKDHHYNNMIFASTLKGRINFYKTSKEIVCLSFAELDDGEVVLRSYESEEQVNIAIWAKGLKKNKEKKSNFKLLFDNIALNNVRFVYVNDDKRLFQSNNTIDYAFFELQHIYLNVDNFLVFGPDISCKINSLSLTQYTGFEISSFSGNFRIYSQGLVLDSLHFKTPNSIFSGDFAFRYDNFPDYADFVNKINFDTKIKSASLDMQDVIYFAPALKGMDNKLLISGYVGGTVNQLQTKDIYVKYKQQTHIAGNFSFDNILDFKNRNSSFDFYIKDACLNFSELEQFKLPKENTLAFPETIKNLAAVTLRGDYKGSITKFNTHLEVETNMGNVKLAVNTIPQQESTLFYSGELACHNLNLGKLMNQPKYLDKVNFRTSLEGNAEHKKGIKELLASILVKVHGKITSVDLCGYPLKDVNFTGNYTQQKINLTLKSVDSVASFTMKGNLNFTKDIPAINASLTYADIKLYELFSHFPHPLDSTAKGLDKVIQKIEQNPDLSFTVDSIAITMSGTQFENINGFAGIDNAKLTNGINTSRIDWFRLNAINKPDLPHQYQIHSNAFNVSLKTNYDFKDIVATLENAAHYYLPAMITGNEKFAAEKKISSTDSVQFIDLDMQLFYTRNLFDLLLPKLDIARNASANIHLGKTKTEDSFNIACPQIGYSGLGKLNNLIINGKANEEDMLVIQMLCDSVTSYQKESNFTFKDIGVKTSSNRKEIQFTTAWRNPKAISINELNHFNGLVFEDTSQYFSLKITDSKLFIRESMWQFIGDDNTMSIGKNGYLFDHCILSSKLGKLSINGAISKHPDSECNILLEDFDISLINNLTSKKGFSFAGDMSLMATITPNTTHFLIEGKSFIKNFVFNEESFGDLLLDATILDDRNLYFMGGFLPDGNNLQIDLPNFSYTDYLSLSKRNIGISGKYNFNEKEVRIHAEMDTLKIGFLSPFLSSFSNLVSGRASGYLDFVMNSDSLYFDGKVRVKNAQLGIAPLNTIYYLNDQEILFNRAGIDFNQVLLKDKYNNEAQLSGYVHHNKFKDFKIDLNISTQRFMALNTPKSIYDPFYGDGFVSGDISIQGDTKQINFSGQNIKTLTGSTITFPLSSANTITSSQGIYFVQKKENKEITINNAKKISTILNFDFIFDITKDADVKLELDPIDGVLKCKTSGKLHLTYNSNSGDVDLDGILSIVSGKFQMSLRNFFPREFAIVEGGTISFIGPLTSAQLNVKALYQKTASLGSLSPSLKDLGRTEILAYLGLTGNLMNPNPSFIFSFPRLTTDDQFNVYLALDTANRQNGIQQFFSFVFLNTFITAESNIDNMGPIGVGTGIDFVSGMLNSFVSNQLNNVSLGINYNNEFEYAEYSVNTAVNFYNDRILLKGNFGYAKNSENPEYSNFLGDVSLDIFLNDERNLLMRFFYFNDKASITTSSGKPQQGGGIGISYQQEFNSRKELIDSWKPKKKAQKTKKTSKP